MSWPRLLEVGRVGQQGDHRLTRRWYPTATELGEEVANVVELERSSVGEEARHLLPEALGFRRIGIQPKAAQRGFGRAVLDEQVLVQIAGEHAPKLAKRRHPFHRSSSGYDVSTKNRSRRSSHRSTTTARAHGVASGRRRESDRPTGAAAE